MKSKIKILSSLVLMAGILTGCSDSFLDRTPEGSYTDANFYASDEALEAVAQSDDSSEIKEKVEQRILWEQVFVRYMRYTYYSGYYSSVEYAEEEEYIYNFFEENGVTNRSEGGRI